MGICNYNMKSSTHEIPIDPWRIIQIIVFDSRSKGAALTRAKRLRKEGDAEIAKLEAQGSKIDAVTESIKARIDELEVRIASLALNRHVHTNDQNQNEQGECFAEHESGRTDTA